jgi:polyphosphate kinase
VKKDISTNIYNKSAESERYFNREVSLIKFNYRVLEEALNRSYPIIERFKFLHITVRNIDEFISVRVGKLIHDLNSKEKTLDGLTAKEQLPIVLGHLADFFSKQEAVFLKLRKEFGKYDIEFDEPHDADEATLQGFIKQLKEKFSNIKPIRFSLSKEIDQSKLTGIKDYLVVKTNTEAFFYPIETSIENPFFVYRDVNLNFVSAKTVLCKYFRQIINIKADDAPENAFTISLIRNGDIDFSNNPNDLDSLEDYEKLFKLREVGKVLFIKTNSDVNEDFLKFIQEKFHLSPKQIIKYRNLSFIKDADSIIDYDFEMAGFNTKRLFFEPIKIRFPERIADYDGNYFKAIEAKDILIHHPYESFDMVTEFIRVAAIDKDVVEIKQTLYRTTKDSPVVKSLIEAQKNGKKVTCFIEVKARFDEERNIEFLKTLQKHGVNIIHTNPDIKTHLKLTLVKKLIKENNVEKEKIYAHFGTGNYNSDTARVYSDLSLFTCNQAICKELDKIFDFIKARKIDGLLEKAFLSPINLRAQLLKLINREIENIKNDKPAGIWLKVNSITDKLIIDKLYEASKAGVKIELVIRGICCLRPGIVGLSENIRVKSIVGRFLEHTRIYCFANGFPMGSINNKVYISSSDLMTRNMDARIEAAIPIENETVFEQILGQIMQANLSDLKNSWYLQADGKYLRTEYDANSISAHEYFVNNPSLSGRGSAIHSVRHLESIAKTIYGEKERTEEMAVIDIGSNSVRMVIYDGLKRVPASILNEKKQCGLIRDFISTGKLNSKGVEEVFQIIPRFLRIIEAMKVKRIYAFATSAVREARDGTWFVKEIKKRFNLEVHIISGIEEAKLSTLGVISGLRVAKGAIGDLGGGSLELAEVDYAQGSENIFHENSFFDKLVSLPLGALRLADINRTQKNPEKIIDSFINENLDKFQLKKALENKTFYAVGGSFRAIAAVDMALRNYSLDIIDNYQVEAKKLVQTLKKIISNKKVVRKVSRAKKREEMIPFAALVLLKIIEIGKPKDIIFSGSGVREGVLFNELAPAIKAQDPLFVAVYDMVGSFTPIHFHTGINKPWIDFSLELAAWINNLFKNESPELLRIKNSACILAWIAWHEINSFRAEVAFRWIIDSKLPSLTHRERVFLAICVYFRYSNKYSKVLDTVKKILSDEDYDKACSIGLMMRLGFKLAGGATGILARTKIAVEQKKLTITFHPSDRCLVSDEFNEAFESLAKSMGLKVVIR